jgi:transcriptional regulator with XRE-family HTH domain
MDRADHLSDLIGDFVFRDRRIADQSSPRVSVFLAEGDILRRVAASGNSPRTLPNLTFRVGEGITGMAFSRTGLAWAPDMPASIREPGDESIRSFIACPIVVSDKPVGVLNLDSQTKLEFGPTDIPRVQVLSALVGYEVFHLQRRVTVPSRLSEELGRVLRSAREELKLTQDDLAALVGTSRIALSRWEAGAQPPSRGPLRRWAAALGLLAGGRPEIITAVDATPQLLEVLRRDPGRLSELSPEQFEVLVAERLDRMGYAIQRTGTTTLRDGGIDIIAVPKAADAASFLLAVQVKHHRGARPTGRDAVDRLLAWQNTAFRLGMLVTNTRFTKDALWTASRDPARHFLRLRDFADLTRWLHGTFGSELDWREIPDSIELAPGVSVHVPKPRFIEAGIEWPLKNAFEPDA